MKPELERSLGAYLDGELDAGERRSLEAWLAGDPASAQRLADLRNTDRLIRSAMPEVTAELPASIVAAIDRLAVANSRQVAIPAGRQVRTALAARVMPRLNAARQYWPLAAGLVLAVVAGVLTIRGPAADQTLDLGSLTAGSLASTHPLSRALQSTLSGSTHRLADGAASVTPVLSFRSHDGDICREFEASAADGAIASIACRVDDRWSIVTIAAFDPQDARPDQFAPASHNMPAEVAATAERLMAGSALDAAAERELLSRGWR